MASLERSVLDFYQVSTPYPTEWPADKNNNSDVSEDESVKKKINRRKSRYQALERAVSTRSSVIPGSESSASGVSNLVQRDEPDPLGTTESVVRTLKQLGLPLQEDTRLRKFYPPVSAAPAATQSLRRNRQPLPPLLDHILSGAFLVADAFGRGHAISYRRSRCVVQVH
jgi:hypothetical protein